MVTKTDQFITQIKLRELREQRARLLNAYEALSQRAASAPTDAARLRVLYEGLQQISFANQSLHPDVANLEPLLLEMQTNAASQETVAFWRARLERELSNGRLRSEMVTIFGALLEEWAAHSGEKTSDDQESTNIQAQLVAEMTRPAETGSFTTLLDTLFASFSYSEADAVSRMQRALGDGLHRRVTTVELSPVLEQISHSPYRSPAERSGARTFLLDDLLQKELADALTLMLEHIEEWAWPEEGLPTRAHWTPNKWRLFIEDGLPNACFLEILGRRWHAIFQKFFQEEQQTRLKQLRRAQSSQTHLIEREQTSGQFHQTAGLSLLGELDIWATADNAAQPHRAPAESIDGWVEYRTAEYGTIFQLRGRMREQLRALEELAGYGSQQSKGAMETALMLLNAEIQVARAAFPNAPLYVVKVDIKDFYPSLPHALLLDLLHRYGLAPAQHTFFRTFLRLPIQRGSEIAPAERGVPNEHVLSDVLGELILSLLDWHVQREAQVQIIRAIDDICFLTPSADEALKAWQAVQAFCDTCGLALNLEKCGAVCIGGELPAALPASQPKWSLLALDERGEWRVNPAAFEDYLAQARQQIAQASSLLAQVETYNGHLKYLIKALGLRLPLGDVHRQSANQAMLHVHHALFGERQGIIATLRQVIQQRFLDHASSTHIPEAWFYWPITAGGPGLVQASVLTAAYAESLARHSRPAVPEERLSGWQRLRGNNEWFNFYAALLNEVRPKAPAPNQVMETLVKDFIQRGSELSSGKQKDLSPYWRWVLYIYGPQILEALGTFRFLISELVPLQLTTRKHGQDEQDEAASDDDIPF
jgi:hypothetical protein